MFQTSACSATPPTWATWAPAAVGHRGRRQPPVDLGARGSKPGSSGGAGSGWEARWAERAAWLHALAAPEEGQLPDYRDTVQPKSTVSYAWDFPWGARVPLSTGPSRPVLRS